MPKLDLESIESTNRTGYPPPYDAPMAKRHFRRLAPAAEIEDFGASYVTLEPGGISSQRHWHEGEDELVVMLEGEAVLVEEGGETAGQDGRGRTAGSYAERGRSGSRRTSSRRRR